MARPSKKGAKAKQKGVSSSKPGDGVPDIYREMLQDAVSSSEPPSAAERPLKRRRVGGRGGLLSDPEHVVNRSERETTPGDNTEGTVVEDQPDSPPRQTVYNDSDSEESDVNWEEVVVDQGPQEEELSDNRQELDLVLGDSELPKPNARQVSRRKPATSAERKLKVDIHKLHVLCLLSHVYLRNHWCNDDKVHQSLRGILSRKTIYYLNPDEKSSQFQRSRSFNDGLSQAVDAWKVAFTITARGLCKSQWAQDSDHIADIEVPQDLDLPMQKQDFRDAAGQREGSRDLGAQLFCALLRLVGVDARLSCSLQPLPFHSIPGTTSVRSKASIAIDKYYTERLKTSKGFDIQDAEVQPPSSEDTPKVIGSIGGRSRFASPELNSQSPSKKSTGTASTGRRRRIVESPYPIYWVEALDEATQKWIPVDPMVTKTSGKARKLEPPSSDRENSMSYVIAFDDEGFARDVTKRYTKAYNAKTRKVRVDAVPDGEKWLKRALKMYKRPRRHDRDQVEDTELARKEAQEGLPQNVQDFKDHPYYALERHMRKNEVIHPKREVGKVTAGRAGSAKGLEPIYRRRDVHVVKSADRWYRLGREIKASSFASSHLDDFVTDRCVEDQTGEQPLKYATPRRGGRESSRGLQSEGNEDEENAGSSLYAFHQTIEYKPPPVIDGKIIKNVYGNVDLYVPSMVPSGAVHLRHPETKQAARLLGIDFADAVTGFAFKGRHGTAIVTGAIVASECAAAVQAVLKMYEDERAQAEEDRRSLEALRMWKKLLVGLRIRERIEGYEVEGERDAIVHDESVSGVDQESDEEAGGFLSGSAEEPRAEPTAGWPFQHELPDQEGYLINDALTNSNLDSSIAKSPTSRQDVVGDNATGDDGGGFLPDEVDEDAEEALRAVNLNTVQGTDSDEDGACEGGGFIVEDDAVASDPSVNFQPHRIIESAADSRMAKDSHSFPDSARTQPEEEIYKAALTSSNDYSSLRSHSPALSLAEDDLAEAMVLQQSYESNNSSRRPMLDEEEIKNIDGDSASRSAMDLDHRLDDVDSTTSKAVVADKSSPKHPTLSVVATPDVSAGDSDGLLEEDPSDEDADPEWLS